MARERQTIPGRDGQSTDRKNTSKTLPTKKNRATISTGKPKPPEDVKKTAIVSNKQKKKSHHSSDHNTASEDDEASDHSSDGEVYNKKDSEESSSSADPSDDDKTDNNASGSNAGGKSFFFFVLLSLCFLTSIIESIIPMAIASSDIKIGTLISTSLFSISVVLLSSNQKGKNLLLFHPLLSNLAMKENFLLGI